MVAIAVVGLGLIGRRHVELVAAEADCSVHSVVDPSPTAAAWAIERGHVVGASLADLLSGARPDAVIIATPNDLHVDQPLACIKAGLPVLVEKPLAPTVAAAARLAAAVARLDARVLVGHHRQHNPLIERAADAVRTGAIGRLVAIQGSALFYKPDRYFAEGPWRTRPGGGPVLINLVHEIGVLRALAGEVTAVQAMASSAVRGFAVEDTVAITLAFASGALGTFLLSDTAASPFSWEQTSGENAAYAHYPEADCYVLAGTAGSLAVPSLRLWRYGAGAERSWWTPFTTETLTSTPQDPLVRQLRHFVAIVRDGAAPRVSAEDGLANLRVCEAILEATRRHGRVVPV